MHNVKNGSTLYRKSHFSPAFLLLKGDRRLALQHLYGVCRVIDDAVDQPTADPEAVLSAWMDVFRTGEPAAVEAIGHGALARDFLQSAKRFGIPLSVMAELIEKGVRVDLDDGRFNTPMDLERYCYGVAGTVGVACLPIFGVPLEDGKNFAVRLGIAVQWVNTIRDVGVDAKMGRIYLPLEHLEQFGYTENELFESKSNDKFLKLMQFEASVARAHYKRAYELMPEKWKRELRPARVMGQIYWELLNKIERRGFPVFREKVQLNVFEKAAAVIKTF